MGMYPTYRKLVLISQIIYTQKSDQIVTMTEDERIIVDTSTQKSKDIIVWKHMWSSVR